MAGFTIPRAFVSMDPWSGTLLVGMPRGVTLPDGRDVGGYSLRKYADEREKTDWRGEEGIRVTLGDGFPARLQRGRGDDVEAVFVDAGRARRCGEDASGLRVARRRGHGLDSRFRFRRRGFP